MVNIIISFLTFALILISLFMVLVILMQRANSNAGMGSAFGGGVTESAFGAETTNILTRATKWSAIAFFIIALVLYLLYMSREGRLASTDAADLPDIPVVVDTPAAEEIPPVVEEAPVAEVETPVLPEEVEAEVPSTEEPASPPAP